MRGEDKESDDEDMTRQLRDCKTCKHSDNGNCAYTEECHECMWERKHEQKPCDDCISKQEVDTLVDELARAISDERCCISRGRDTATIMQDILDLPSVTPQPKMGRLIFSGGYWRCSECKEKALLKLDKSKGNCREYMPIKSNYCPDCGAKMEV